MKLRIAPNFYERLKRCASWVEESTGKYANLRWKHRKNESIRNAPEDVHAVKALISESPRSIVMTVPDCDARTDDLIVVLAEAVVRVERRMRQRGWREDAPPPPVEGKDYYIAGKRYPGVGLII